MKTIKLRSTTKKIFLGILTIFMIFSLNFCSRKVSFLNSSVVPAARGYVKVKTDKNKNFIIQIQLIYLAEVQRLQPAKQVYIVWMVTDRGITTNIGRLNSSTSGMSKNLKGSLETLSSFKPTKIFITAEDDASVQYPLGQVVLTTDSFIK